MFAEDPEESKRALLADHYRARHVKVPGSLHAAGACGAGRSLVSGERAQVKLQVNPQYIK